MQIKRIFSGIQPTGVVHIGNYLGAIRNWVRLQNSYPNDEHYYCIVDYHALTDKYKLDHEVTFDTSIKEQCLVMAATLIASGIDPNKSTLFLQSQVPQHAELQWIISCIAPQNWLNKMTQYKDKAVKTSTLGLYTYPVLMAADILLYQATDVPVGEDQKQHVELCRDYALRFNSLFARNDDSKLVIPNYIECKTKFPRVMSLKDSSKKMSKADQNDQSRINMLDDVTVIFDKIRKAKTDSLQGIKYDAEQRPEISNLIKIYSTFADISPKQVEKQFHNQPIQKFKESLAEQISKEIAPIAIKTQELLHDKETLMTILKQGNEKAQLRANRNIQMIKKQIGLLTF